jgi:hypothetical protein
VDESTGDTIVRMNLSFSGKYLQFLEALQSDYQIIQAYIQSFKTEQTISPKMIEGVMFNYRLYNMSDLRMRLFIALHYLTVNDIYERRNAG